jgi:3-methyladenine DNA glycosylase/8-oxoguanine DNA glycosylase
MGSGRTVTYLTPPRISRFPALGDSLEYATRSMVVTSDGRGIWRAWGDPEAPWPIRVEPAGARWRVEATGVSPARAREAARALFSLEHPIEEFYRLVRREPILRGTDRRFRGLRLPRDASLYESLVSAVIGQQLSVQAAATLTRRLHEATDSYLTVDGIELPTIPSPRAVLRRGAVGLRSVGLSRAKTKSLLGIARGQVEGRFPTPTFRRMGAEEAIERLDAEPGVGRWTAENALLRGVGRTDLFVAGDLGLRVALAEYGVLPRHAPEEAARAWADAHYPQWGSYATVYLWKKLVTDLRAREEEG